MPSSDSDPPERRSHVATGRRYERRAAEFYQKQGFTILERNWRDASREIDLIARRDNLIVFVEVKAARSKSFGHPAEWVDQRKQERLIAAACRYLSEHDTTDCDLRFDLVAFFGGNLEHFPDAFRVEE